MKTLLLICMALICAVFSVSAQEVRLDSLWVIYGGFGAMTFSPDSKTLLIAEPQKLAGGSGTIRFYDAATGIEKDSIPGTEYYDVRYTPDGKSIVQVGFGGEIKLYNAETYKLEKSINAPQNAGYIDFSPDRNIIVSAGSNLITVVDITEGVVKAVINRPYQYSIGPNKTDYYWNGKVCFSADGKYVIGKYANSLVQWDWRNTPIKPETLIAGIPNRAILSFSHDKKYLVQQSNYLWDIAKKTRILLPLEEGNTEDIDAPFTQGSRYLICTGARLLHVVDIESQRILYKGSRGRSGLISISPDSSIIAYARGAGNTAPIIERVTWLPTGITDIPDSLVTISFFPLPGADHATINIKGITARIQCSIRIIDHLGKYVMDVFSGLTESSSQSFTINTQSLASGEYYVAMRIEGHDYVKSFIISR